MYYYNENDICPGSNHENQTQHFTKGQKRPGFACQLFPISFVDGAPAQPNICLFLSFVDQSPATSFIDQALGTAIRNP